MLGRARSDVGRSCRGDILLSLECLRDHPGFGFCCFGEGARYRFFSEKRELAG